MTETPDHDGPGDEGLAPLAMSEHVTEPVSLRVTPTGHLNPAFKVQQLPYDEDSEQ